MGTPDSPRGFRPAHRLLTLANALREQPDLARSGLAEILLHHGERPEDLTGGAFSAADAEGLRRAVVRMSAVLAETDVDRAAQALNQLLDACGARPRLTRHDGHGWHLHVDRGDEAGWDEWFVASSSMALAQRLSEHGRLTWGVCAAAGCSAYYLDDAPGSPRRYCSTRCASRARVAAHRSRRRRDG
ncbi:CGNR zinc finger domain-containing protein [Streptomyces sp. 549]|uniref:CGNR zinc finger domain-containing protein n=1 Tax=Streptomyces sp. 549 TaxID=3049076 RepID=UPI0024C2C296|nr:CGNR zinc finger domain-containing protein [Streptomyces sp. 549]MDK1472817.1 CGNR zinc finger domain-containing protein [Streptomyces sp. 549]